MSRETTSSGAVHEARILLYKTDNALERLAVFTGKFAETAGLSRECSHALDLALTEWITNILSYGFQDALKGRISVRLSTTSSEVRAEVEDNGTSFNPLERPEVDTAISIDKKPIGGLGIHMIRKYIDTIVYERRNLKNALSMSRHLDRVALGKLPPRAD